jgi:uncharacterized membrane protein
MNTICASLILASLTLSACNYNHLKSNEKSSGKVDAQKLLAPDYATVQMLVIGPRCLGCHSNASGNKGSTNLEGYANVRHQLNRISFRALEKMDMPTDSPLSSEQMQILKAWLELGAPETVIASAEAPETDIDQGLNDWKKINEKVFAKKCLDCHSQPSPQGNLDLNSYQEVKNKGAMIFDRVILKQDMPVEPYPTLSPKERKVLLNWFNMGMPQ